MKRTRVARWMWGLGLLGLVLVAWLAAMRPPVPQRQVSADSIAPAGRVRATFVGVSTVLFDDGHSAVLVDGFFTRPGLLKTALGRVGPDESAVRAGLKRLGVLDGPLQLLAVVTVHSHYDHAMDAPLVARLTGAMLVGSASTRFIGLGQGLDASQIEVPDLGEVLRFGPFSMRLIPSLHSPTPWNNGHDGGALTQALVPPVHASRYLEGGSYSVYMEHQSPASSVEQTRWLIQGSAGYLEGKLDPIQAETVFLGVGTLGRKPTRYKETYWLEVVTAVGARLVVPVHWDDFTIGLDQPLKPFPYWLDNVHSTERFLRGKAALDDVAVYWMAGWETLMLPSPTPRDVLP